MTLATAWILILPALPQAGPSEGSALWSLRRPERAEVPAAAEGGRGPIDAFVRAGLAEQGLAPSPEAPPAQLLRRVSLDLTGLPPTLAELDAFLAETALEAEGEGEGGAAYERAVDRLLASPAFGERMAQSWMDVARYSDTNGHDFDIDRSMWPWRDWVIRAFNENKPFDEFTIEQLAGDLLPDATLDQRVATGFLRNHPIAEQSFGQPGQFHHEYVVDRVATVATAWLGLTVACAQCHDHKFDPISQRDYYRFYAYFDSGSDRGLERGGNAAPKLLLPTAEQGARLVELQGRAASCTQRLNAWSSEEERAFHDWLDTTLAEQAAPPPADLHFPLDADEPGRAEVIGIGQARWVDGLHGGALELDGKDALIDCGDVADYRADQAFSGGVWVAVRAADNDMSYFLLGRFDEPLGARGFSLWLDGGHPSILLAADAREGKELEVTARDPLPSESWSHVCFTYDGSRTSAGLRLYVDGEPVALRPPEGPQDALVGEIDADTALRIGASDGAPYEGLLDDVRLYSRELEEHEVAALVRDGVRAAAGYGSGSRERTERRGGRAERLVRGHFAAQVHPDLRALAEDRRECRAEQRLLERDVALVSVVSESPRETHFMHFGGFDQPGDVVEPGVPEVLPQLLEAPPADRLQLARWLVHEDHPLTGRVVVNRLWQQLMGAGLVRTPDDFGTRGELPSHPALLDWLAREFVDGGWDYKALVREIVTSATYRQASDFRDDLREEDPENRALARASRVRLEAETIRDNALAIAGLLDRRVGGRSVRPWQPQGLWRNLSEVEDRYRRGLYVYHKRHAPYVSFALFDQPARDVCNVRRDRTTTPLQALALLNDRVYVEAGRALAQRVLGTEGEDEARLARAFRWCTAREPDAEELEVLRGLLEDQRGRYAGRIDDAEALLAVGDHPVDADAAPPQELAAWTVVAGVLLNLDETITRG